ncbi:MAG: acetoacetate decarboxylase family protein [bacterium]|nr:acetoacetate decarboxylase family protein [bacterium]
MARVRYARSPRESEDARNARREKDEGFVRLLVGRYETDPEALAAVVPRPLEAAPENEVEIVVATVGEGALQRGSALIGVRVDYDGTAGVMPLSMPCDDAAAVAEARERFGEPRKQGTVDLVVDGDGVSASVTRRDVLFLRLGGRRREDLDRGAWASTSFSFKAFPAVDPTRDFDHDPQLVRSDWRFEPTTAVRLDGGIELWDSPFDPIADLPVRRLVELRFGEGRYARSARVVRPVPGDWLWPFLHQRDDAPGSEGVEV